jgi:hypothetical protein
VIGLTSALILGFYFDFKLRGIWGGWCIGLIALVCYEIRYLSRI